MSDRLAAERRRAEVFLRLADEERFADELLAMRFSNGSLTA
jgi:hypothetical protein